MRLSAGAAAPRQTLGVPGDRRGLSNSLVSHGNELICARDWTGGCGWQPDYLSFSSSSFPHRL